MSVRTDSSPKLLSRSVGLVSIAWGVLSLIVAILGFKSSDPLAIQATPAWIAATACGALAVLAGLSLLLQRKFALWFFAAMLVLQAAMIIRSGHLTTAAFVLVAIPFVGLVVSLSLSKRSLLR